MTTQTTYHVGQELWIDSVNNRRGDEGMTRAKVAKVGRTLVHVETRWGTTAFRMETGHANDAYGHEFLMTDAQVADRRRRAVAQQRLRDLGVEFTWRRGHVDAVLLENIALLCESAAAERGRAEA